ncbi:MAG: SLC13 family permease [Candidatus Nezhaarchaeota archaeon]|nr:SLC13 family permease [Candidatus Nezhaarchaeota archaeon]
MEANMMPSNMIIAIIIFVASIVLIAWGRVHRAYVGLVSATIFIVFGLLPLNKVLSYLDINVIGLLTGMAVITYYLERSGFTDWVTITFLKFSGFKPLNALLILAMLGSLISAVLDNVSTTLLLAPIAFRLASSFGVSAVPYVLAVALGSNLVGAALMIGDPPSMMVASALNLSFIDFIVFEGRPGVFFIIMAACPIAALTLLVTAKKYVKSSSSSADLKFVVSKNEVVLAEALTIFFLVVLLLSVRKVYEIPLWVPPIIGALVILALRAPVEKSLDAIIKGVDWKTIAFVVSILLMSGGLAEVGFIDLIAKKVYEASESDVVVTSAILIWISVLFSAFIDNIPYFAIMIPMVMTLSKLSGMDVYTLMWALLIGGSLGGNCTYIGASANAVAVGLLEKRGYKVSFLEFTKLGVPYTMTAVLIGEALHYLIFIHA